jgi:hypothetical protein
MPVPRQIAMCGALVAATVGLTACGGSDDVAARIDGAPITKAAIGHWTSVLEPGASASGSPGQRGQARQRRAIDFLISARWLVGEAASRGLGVSRQDVQQQVAERQAAFAGGEAEYHKALAAKGEDVGDVELQVQAELASARLRQLATASLERVTPSQVAAYYAHHRQRFVLPERRVVRMSNRKTRAAAAQLKREVDAGQSLTSVAQHMVGEGLMTFESAPGARNQLELAVYAARPHHVVGPFKGSDVEYDVFEVEQVIPPVSQTFARVKDTIRTLLLEERARRALADLGAAVNAKWTPRTKCDPGYVVQKCSQYNGPKAPEDPLSLG